MASRSDVTTEDAVIESRRADDHVAFRVGNLVSNDLRLLFAAAAKGMQVMWYTRAQMMFMATCGPQWKRLAQGPALHSRGNP